MKIKQIINRQGKNTNLFWNSRFLSGDIFHDRAFRNFGPCHRKKEFS